MFCTSCFHVAAMNPSSTSERNTAARSVPTLTANRPTRSAASGQVPDHSSATGMARSTNTHVSAVLRIVVFTFAAINAASLRGRVAMNGSRPPVSLDLETVAATNSAMNTGVTSTPSTISSTSTGTLLVSHSSASSNGSRMPTRMGSDLP